MASIQTRRRKDGGQSYTVRIRLKADGVIIHEEVKTFDGRVWKRKDVERWAGKREAELHAPGALHGAQNAGVTLGQAIRRYRLEYATRDQWGRSKRADLARLENTPLARLPMARISSANLIDHVRARRDGGAGPATAGNDLVWLRVLYQVARPAWGVPVSLGVIDDAIAHCRAQRLIARAEQRTRRPTLEELDALLEWFTRGDGRAQIPMAEVILFALFSARRESEICALRRDDLDGDTILVRGVKDPRKRGLNFKASLTPEARLILERQPDTGPLFFPFNPRSVQAAFTRACKMKGIEDLHFHDLRHEGVSRLFELGWTIPQAAMVSGHRSWQNLQRYTHLSGAQPLDKYAGWKWRPTPPDDSVAAATDGAGVARIYEFVPRAPPAGAVETP